MNKLIKKLSLVILIFVMIFTNVASLFAATATISVSSSNSVIIGNTFNVTVKISSSAALGSWDYFISYDTSKFKLVSGKEHVAEWVSNKTTKSKSYTYKFKALSTGSGKITVKVNELNDYNESSMKTTINSKTIKVISQSEHKASLSKNNNLSSLSIDGLTLSPTFSSSVTEYKAEAKSNTQSIKINAKLQDSKADLSGNGTFNVSEGENKFTITVTAQNGSIKKYNIVVNVIDPNPISVNIDNEEYIIVKRESNLEKPENFEKKDIKISDQIVPGFYSDTNKLTLVGLKNNDGKTFLYIYDDVNNTYSEYKEINLNKIKIYPLKIDKQIENYIKDTTIINEYSFESLKINNDSAYSIIHAKNLENGEDDYYIYDSKTNTIIRYNEENLKPYKEKIENYKKMFYILIGETFIIFLILIGILISKISKNKKRKNHKDENIKTDIKEEKLINRKK